MKKRGSGTLSLRDKNSRVVALKGASTDGITKEDRRRIVSICLPVLSLLFVLTKA